MNSDGAIRELKQGEKPTDDEIPVPAGQLDELTTMNRAGRRAFYAETRRGAAIGDAMAAARQASRR